MNKWRLTILAVLLLVPALFLMAMGSWHLWTTEIWGHQAWLILWWPSAACLALAFFLAWWWQRRNRLVPHPDWTPDLHWTARDKEAWQLVETRAKNVQALDPNDLLEVEFYFNTAHDLAAQLARFYHPSSTDPFGPLRIPEILAVVQLASEDLTELVDNYLPGGHLLTIDHWRRASKLSDWYGHATTAYWIISALYSPINTATRFLASKAGVSRPLELLSENLKVWFYTAFVHRVGHYLVELNSGRLRVGAKRYRELMHEHGFSDHQEPMTRSNGASENANENGAPLDRPVSASSVTITLIGRVKAGKSSVINALLGERRAATDVLPMTDEITGYQLTLPSNAEPRAASSLTLLDTVGYAHESPKADQLDATIDAVRKSDIVLFVLHARDPARQPDVELLQTLESWFREHPQLRMPPFIGVLTHVDLLSPAMEWSPPYDFVQPRRPKEASVDAAVTAIREQFGAKLDEVVPVCSAAGKEFGVQELLLPAIVKRLDEARAVAFLRCLQGEINEHKVRRVLAQFLGAGKQLYRLAKERKTH
jgi:uncharacterized protein